MQDKLCYIIKTTDRNLALLLGRALDAQKFFHDVNYEHRLRDSVHEMYQFQERVNMQIPGSPYGEDEMSPAGGLPDDIEVYSEVSTTTLMHFPTGPDETLPNGVFTILTECYSPTCSRDTLCYSALCPRRLEQVTAYFTI